jgi:hypothetical protein
MVVIPKYDGPYTVFVTNGEVAVFETRAQVVRWLGGYRAMQGELCNERPGDIAGWQTGYEEDHPFWTRRAQFLILNCLGDALTLASFSEFAPREDEFRFSLWRFPGSRRAAYRNWLRYPRTQNERRLNSAVLKDEGEPHARNVRSGSNLPSSWDDFTRASQRSWKEHRRKQYHR